MNVPDYVSPIVAYRAWQWNFARSWTSTPPLKSLNGEWWFPGRPLSAKCGAPVARRSPTVRNNHNAPQIDCRCGIYAAKSFDQLRWMGYNQRGISGEVNLWGSIVEHKFGWRAQFAYPKTLVLPFNAVLIGTNEVLARVKVLTAYGADILIDDGRKNITLWAKDFGYDWAGLDYLRTWQLAAVVPIAVLRKGDSGTLLQNGVSTKHSAEIAFNDLRLPLTETDPIVRQIREPQAKVVVLDLIPFTVGFARCVIRAIRKANNQILIFARGEMDPMDALTSLRFAQDAPDAYLASNAAFDVQAAYTHLSVKRMNGCSKAGAFSSRRPWGPPPRPAVSIYSPWGRLPKHLYTLLQSSSGQAVQQKFGVPPRELEIVAPATAGYSNKEIAEYFKISKDKVEDYSSNVSDEWLKVNRHARKHGRFLHRFASALLLVFFAPLLLIVTLAVLVSTGRVFTCTDQVANGRKFKRLQFHASGHLGKHLWRTRINELPLLINVLRGEVPFPRALLVGRNRGQWH